MELKHTPGPWQIEGEEDGDYYWISPVASGGYGWVGDRYMKVSGHMDISDARLIAAAPDLLAAARQALTECVDLFATPAGEALEAAIAKATGSAA